MILRSSQDHKVPIRNEMELPSSIRAGIPNYVFRRTISLMTDAPFRIDMQPRSKLIETYYGGRARNGWNSTTDHLLFRVSPWHPQFLLCAPTFPHSRRVPHRGEKYTSRRLSPSWQGIWPNLTETYAYHCEFLLATGERREAWCYNNFTVMVLHTY